MAGHNKWTQIKRKKAITDGAKSKIFSKFSRLITLESKKFGGNVNSPSLKTVIEHAKSYNMPSDNIDRAIKKGTGADAGELERVTYEAYGPEGAALIIEAVTGNRNKASAEVKHILGKHGGVLGTIGSVTWAFVKDGDGSWEAVTPLSISPEASKVLEGLIEELEENEEVQDVFTNALPSEETK